MGGFARQGYTFAGAPMKNKNGFTLIEILIAMTIMTVLISLSVAAINYNSNIVNNTANELLSKVSDIEAAFNQYVADKNNPPTGLTDATFTPTYLFTPLAPTGYDQTYGTSGFTLAQRTGQASPDNGWYVCAKVTVPNSGDPKFQALKKIATMVSPQKFFYNTSCPATTTMADPAAAATIYPVYWIMRN